MKFLLLFCFGVRLFSWEVDNFSMRQKLLNLSKERQKKDLFRLNDKTNSLIQKALDKYNKKHRTCEYDQFRSIPRVFEFIENSLGGGFVSGKLERWMQSQNSLLYSPEIEKSIYDGNFLGLKPHSSFNIGGVILSPDKIGHAVDIGFDMFKVLKEKGFKEALSWSNGTEEYFGIYGLGIIGIKSFADMSANTAGMHLYINISGLPKAHLKCNFYGDYELNYPVNWADYLDNSVDEAINCSTFISTKNPIDFQFLQEFETKNIYENLSANGKIFQDNLSDMYFTEEQLAKSQKDKLTNSCPVSSGCKRLLNKNCSTYITSPVCFVNSKDKKRDLEKNCLQPKAGSFPVRFHHHKDYKYKLN